MILFVIDNWLRSIDAETAEDPTKKLEEWQETAKRIAAAYARELVAETDDAALVGHLSDGKFCSAQSTRFRE